MKNFKRLFATRLSLVLFALLTTLVATAILARTALTQSDSQGGAAAPAARVDARLSDDSRKSEPSQNSPVAQAGKQGPAAPRAVENASNYSFSTATNASFTSMSSGTTQLVGATQDETPSIVTNIGFDFYFLGARFTQFSASANGFVRLGGTTVAGNQYTLGTAGVPLIAAYGSDLFVSTVGKVHYKVTGAAPNRVLTVEFLNETVIYDAAGATADCTSQVRLYETTGIIELVYGQMNRNSSTGFLGGMHPQYVGFSNNSTDNTYATVTTSTNTVNTTGAPASNQPPLSTPIANLNTPVDGSRRIYGFAPATPTAPTNLTFTGVTPLAMTLNWTDSPNETLYALYRSTDGVNFTFETTLAQNSVSHSASGLSPGTTYFWQVSAVSDGRLSALSGSQMTAAGGSIASVAGGGLWSSNATWVGGNVPSNTDNVTIADGTTVTIDTAAVALSLAVGTGGAASVLQFESTIPRTLTVGFSVTITTNGTIQSATTGIQTAHELVVGANLINNGVLDLSTAANAAGANLTFTGAASNTWSGAGLPNDIRTLTINKGTSSASVLELTATNFSVQGVVTDSSNAAFLTLTNGTLKVSSAFIANMRTFNVAAYTIGATAGFWLNNPNYTVTGQLASPTNNGLLRVTQGTLNVGTAAGIAMAAGPGASFIIEGGATNLSGRLNTASAVTYSQTGGTVNVCTVGNASSMTASFGLTSTSTVFTMSGGTINLVQINSTGTPGNRRDYSVAGTANITGGTLNVGTGFTVGNAGNFDFRISGQVPALVLTNTTNAKNVVLAGQMNTFGNVTVNTGCSVNTVANPWFMIGTTITNNGTITVPNNGGRVIFLGSGPQAYTGTGTTTIVTGAGSVDLTVDNATGLTIDPASNGIITQRVNFFRGGITNANKLTLGNGGATVGVVQYGAAGSPDTAGNFDVAPTFNVGSGGQTILYQPEGTARTTGPEIPASRTIVNATIGNTNGVVLAGGDLTLAPTTATSVLTFTAGNLTTNANILILNSATTVARTSGHVIGNFRKTYAGPANKTFEVGTANGFSPVTVNITSGIFPAIFTTKAVQGPQPNIGSPGKALQRYWTLTGSNVTADLTFNYLDPTDVPVTAVEGNFVILKYDGMFTAPGGTVNTVANTATITAVTTFSDWTVAEPTAPTAVELASVNATEFDTGTYLQWTTGAEVRNLGFNIYRDEGGKRTQVNPQLIAGGALLAGSDTVLRSGKSYSWWISAASGKSPAQYWLEDVDVSGQSTWHGPIGATRFGGKPPTTSDAAVLSQVGVAESQAGASVQVARSAALTRVAASQIKLQSDLAGKQAVKISVRREGWYRVTQADLLAAGFNSKIDPQMLQMYVDGRQIPISVITNQKQISAVDFYGRGIDASYTDARVYWLVAGTQPGLRVPQVKGEGYPTSSRSFLYTVERRDKTIYFSALRNGDKENFFGAVIAGQPVDQTLNLQHVDEGAPGQAQLEVSLQGVTQLSHRVWAYLNGTFVGELMFNGQALGVAKLPVSQTLLREGDNQVRFEAQGGTGDVSLVDGVKLGYFHEFTADNNALRFGATGGQAVTIGGFGSGAIRVLDVTDPDSVREVVGKVQQMDGVYSITVASPQSGERVLLAGIDEERSRPARVTDNKASNLRSAEHAANLVIIANRETISAVEPLRAKRASQGFKVEVVNVEDIFDEFSFGNKTPQAVRDFLLYTQTGWKLAPQYVLLVGDASLDPKGYLGLADSDLVPTMMIDTALLETAWDDGLADFNWDGMPELALGRLPVRTGEEAARMIEKIVGYDQSAPSGSVMLVADGNDGFDFESASLNLVSLVPGSLKVDVLNRGQVDPAIARSQLIDGINRGQKVVNYLGHGSVNVWRGGLLTNEDAAGMVNGRLPLFMMMTCLNGYFQDPGLDSLAESLMKSRGGAIAVWASSGMTGPEGQAAMDRQVFELIFRGSGIKGQAPTLGEAMLRAKRGVGDIDVRRTYTLFGDPTTRLR